MTVTILKGDCRETLKELPSKSVQCCVTSPPYFGLRNYDHANQIGQEATPDAFVAQLVSVFREVHRVLKDNGSLWLNLGDSYASFRDGKVQPDTARGDSLGTVVPKGSAKNRMASTFANTSIKHKDLIGIPWKVAFALQNDGWYLRQDIIWHKPNPMPESVKDRCTKSHEYIFLLTKSPRYYYDSAAIAEDAIYTGLKGQDKGGFKDAKNYNGKHSDKKVIYKGSGVDKTSAARGGDRSFNGGFPEGNGKRNKRSVWTVATNPFKGAHFATFPPGLIEPCVLAGSAKGDIVLDPFGGAGTTGLVADRNGRNAILCELNPDYVDIARKRITNDVPLLRTNHMLETVLEVSDARYSN